jgi:uncharacterized membrane-anchored protein
MEAKEGLSTQLEAFAAATMEYMKQERTLLLDGVGVPQVQTPMAGRHVLVVARGYDYRDDLVSLRHYIKEFRPVLIGVDGGAEALVEAGYHPDVIVGDLHAVSDEILRGGAEVVVRADQDGRAAALERVQDIGVDVIAFPTSGTSEDVALLLADAHAAEVIVAVGTHATRLYRSRISVGALLVLVFVTLVTVGVIFALAADGRAWTAMIAGWWDQAYAWVKGLGQ